MTDNQDDYGVEAIGKLMELLRPMNDATRVNVLQFVFKALNIVMPGETPPTPYPPTPTLTTSQTNVPRHHAPLPSGAHIDLRSLTEQKQPKSANQMVAVMAYYLANHAPTDQRRDYITSDDIKKYFPQANFELPTGSHGQILVNAKNAGYLESFAPGQYRLNPVGHNLVTHKLPRGEGGGTTNPRQRSAKKERKAKKKARK